ncbi:MAG TPA: heavy metal translocating P-type ATPase, partial [Armatimonadota bacterium]|nr:heavy metal translocating P-type ATPase [Armatimonadota bacterium]
VIAGSTTVFSLLRMVSVFIVACPHALGLAIPTVVIISSTLGAHAGILIRNNQATETAGRLDSVSFDQTGTLTTGQFSVTDVIPLGQVKADDILLLAAGVERNSEHSLARGISNAASSRKLHLPEASEFRAIPGRGARAVIYDTTVFVGNQGMMDRQGISTAAGQGHVDTLTEQGKTIIFVASETTLVGLIALADTIRPESYAAIEALQEMGVETAMLTGDHENVAAYVAHHLGLDTYFAEVHPEEKADKVKALQKEGKRVAMVGDGINDAPALVQADVGIAIGAGTQVAIESADIVLVKNDPRDVVSMIRLSRATASKMTQNIWWAAGYNIIAIPIAAGVLAPYGIVLQPEWAALLMAASSIIVVLNALLLRRLQLVEPSAEAAEVTAAPSDHEHPEQWRAA